MTIFTLVLPRIMNILKSHSETGNKTSGLELSFQYVLVYPLPCLWAGGGSDHLAFGPPDILSGQQLHHSCGV